MRNIKKLINQFNHPDNLLVVSGWPRKGKNHGIASFTKATILATSRSKNQKIVVLAETNCDNTPVVEADGDVLILRVFDKNHPSLFPVILRWLKKFDRIKTVQVHSEFCANGGAKNFMLLIPFLGLIKLSMRKIIFFAHNVVEDFNELAPHFNLRPNSLRLKLLNFSIKSYYVLLGLVVDKIVVLNEILEKRLRKFVLPSKVMSIFHPIWRQAKNSYSRQANRAKLGIKKNEKVLLYFGFCSWYKGVDWLINAFDILSKRKAFKNWHLIVAGGPSYTMEDKPYYQRYYQNLLEKASRNSQITITGFVANRDIPKYFKAADLAILPYRTIIGASGCMAQAIAFNKPMILSKNLKAVIDNNIWNKALNKAKLNRTELMFSLNLQSLAKILQRFDQRHFSKKLNELTQSLHQQLSLKSWVKIFDEKLSRKTLLVSTFNSVKETLNLNKYVSFKNLKVSKTA